MGAKFYCTWRSCLGRTVRFGKCLIVETLLDSLMATDIQSGLGISFAHKTHIERIIHIHLRVTGHIVKSWVWMIIWIEKLILCQLYFLSEYFRRLQRISHRKYFSNFILFKSYKPSHNLLDCGDFIIHVECFNFI